MDHDRALELVAEAICSRRCRSVRAAIRDVRRNHPNTIRCTDRHLRRLYSKRRQELELAYFVERELYQFGNYYDEDKERAADARGFLQEEIASTWHDGDQMLPLAEELPLKLPLERWTLDELETAFLALGGDPEALWWR